jgi:hypothetical protein
MFIQFFSSHFSEGIFCLPCPNSPKKKLQVCVPKSKSDKRKGEIKAKTRKKKKTKEKNMYIVYKELSSSKISF